MMVEGREEEREVRDLSRELRLKERGELRGGEERRERAKGEKRGELGERRKEKN